VQSQSSIDYGQQVPIMLGQNSVCQTEVEWYCQVEDKQPSVIQNLVCCKCRVFINTF